MSKRKIEKYAFGVGRGLILAIYLIMVLAPIYWMFVTSFKTDKEIVNVNKITFWP